MTRRRTSRKVQTAGFTLIEVLVALVVTAGVIAASGYALRVVTLTAGRGVDAMSQLDTMMRGFAALRRDLARFERFIETERELTRFAFVGTRQQVAFPLVEPGFPTEPGTYWVTYSVRQVKGLSQLVRSRAPYDPQQRRPDRLENRRDAEESVVVLEGPYSFGFTFEERTGPRPRWVETWTDAKRLPALIKFEVIPASRSVATPPPILVRARIDGEIGCADTKFGACTPKTAGALPDLNTPPPAATPAPVLR